MESYVNIKTDPTGKKLYQASLDTCHHHTLQLEFIHQWLIDIEKFEALQRQNRSVPDFSTIKNLYQLQALFIIASTDLTVITCQMHLFKDKLQNLFFDRQLNLTIYEAHGTYCSHKQFLRQLISSRYPNLERSLLEIAAEEKEFVRKFRIKSDVSEIRNKVGGHIHKDFKEWYQTVNTLNAEKDALMAIAFMDLFIKIFNLTTRLTELEHNRFMAEEQN